MEGVRDMGIKGASGAPGACEWCFDSAALPVHGGPYRGGVRALGRHGWRRGAVVRGAAAGSS